MFEDCRTLRLHGTWSCHSFDVQTGEKLERSHNTVPHRLLEFRQVTGFHDLSKCLKGARYAACRRSRRGALKAPARGRLATVFTVFWLRLVAIVEPLAEACVGVNFARCHVGVNFSEGCSLPIVRGARETAPRRSL